MEGKTGFGGPGPQRCSRNILTVATWVLRRISQAFGGSRPPVLHTPHPKLSTSNLGPRRGAF